MEKSAECWPSIPRTTAQRPQRRVATTKQPKASIYDLIAGMDIATLAVRSMISRFPSAKFHPDEDWDVEETNENAGAEQDQEEYEEKDEKQREKDREYGRSKCQRCCRS